jgi:chemotaxis protein CheX
MEPANLALAANLDILAAEPLRSELLALRGQDVTLDASQVERLGGLCLQVLMSAQKTWELDDRGFEITPKSDAFLNQWAAFGGPDRADQAQGVLS